MDNNIVVAGSGFRIALHIATSHWSQVGSCFRSARPPPLLPSCPQCAHGSRSGRAFRFLSKRPPAFNRPTGKGAQESRLLQTPQTPPLLLPPVSTPTHPPDSSIPYCSTPPAYPHILINDSRLSLSLFAGHSRL